MSGVVLPEEHRRLNIPNHVAARLSELDLRMAHAVKPGGNWKQIPEDIPSKRLEQIRASFKRGEGSRSTYYGRLRPDRPAYTINTWYTRPGNGCHLHYDYAGGQHRTLSHREAARLQGFPDSFSFEGSNTAVAKQIGNAVPPIVAFRIARAIPARGQFLDLFAGAGGLGLGFRLAGWAPIVANDIDPTFLSTYARNVDQNVVTGDIRNPGIFESLVLAAKSRRSTEPLWVLGGPPCQGFSTAGNRRSTEDERNHLVWRYQEFLDVVQPDGFLFENVTGLLNMEGGAVFRSVLSVLGEVLGHLDHWTVAAEHHGVPQRRTRVILLGHSGVQMSIPHAVTLAPKGGSDPVDLPRAVSVEEAIGDLPALRAGEDGSWLEYSHEPDSLFQKFARGILPMDDYVLELERRALVSSGTHGQAVIGDVVSSVEPKN